MVVLLSIGSNRGFEFHPSFGEDPQSDRIPQAAPRAGRSLVSRMSKFFFMNVSWRPAMFLEGERKWKKKIAGDETLNHVGPRPMHPDTPVTTESVPESRLVSSRLERYVAYDRTNRAYTAWQVDQFRHHLGQRVLEIGCGVGGVIDLLGRRELILGLDVEADVLAHVARRFGDRPECEFAQVDFGAMPDRQVEALRERRFDTIICINVLGTSVTTSGPFSGCPTSWRLEATWRCWFPPTSGCTGPTTSSMATFGATAGPS